MLKVDYIKSKLVGMTFVEKIYYFHEIDSTNNFAKSLEHDNVLVLTDNQLQGKGRMGREWESEAESNLTFTVKKKFEVDPDELQCVNFFTSYVLYDMLKQFIAEHTEHNSKPDIIIKWPNDLLLGSKKVCGILIENSLNKREFTIGIGINVNQECFKSGIEGKATSLRNYLNQTVDLDNFLIKIISLFDKNLYLITEKQYDKLYYQWRSSCMMINHDIKFTEDGKNTIAGKIIDLKRDGSILVLVEGKQRSYFSADITIDSFLD